MWLCSVPLPEYSLLLPVCNHQHHFHHFLHPSIKLILSTYSARQGVWDITCIYPERSFMTQWSRLPFNQWGNTFVRRHAETARKIHIENVCCIQWQNSHPQYIRSVITLCVHWSFILSIAALLGEGVSLAPLHCS